METTFLITVSVISSDWNGSYLLKICISFAESLVQKCLIPSMRFQAGL